MARYTLQRLIYMIITLFIIATATFFLMKLLPGSPLQNQEKLSPEQQKIVLEKYGLNDPVPVQYVRYLGNLVKGDLGISFQYDNRPVTELIGDRIGIGTTRFSSARIRDNCWYFARCDRCCSP